MTTLRNITELLLPVPETELKPLLTRFQEQLCKFFQLPASLLYIADSMDSTHFHYEAAAGFAQEPSPKEFREGEGFLGQAVKEKRPLPQSLTEELLHGSPLSALVEVERVTLFAIPLIYQNHVEGLWILASDNPNLLDTLQSSEAQEFLYQTAVYLQSVRARRSVQSLLEQSQLQNQELISREEELRQNLEELWVTQEEMRRAQKLLEERTHWQAVYTELKTLLENVATSTELHPITQQFAEKLGRHLGVQAVDVEVLTPDGPESVAHWSAADSSPFPEGWRFSAALPEASEQFTLLPFSASELHLSPEPESWLLVPGYFSGELLGFLLIGGTPEILTPTEVRAKFYQDTAQAFVNTYRRTLRVNRIAKDFYTAMGQASKAKVSTASRASLKTGNLPWLSEIPAAHQAEYVESLRKTAEEGQIYWIPPMETGAREMVTLTTDQLFRIVWP